VRRRRRRRRCPRRRRQRSPRRRRSPWQRRSSWQWRRRRPRWHSIGQRVQTDLSQLIEADGEDPYEPKGNGAARAHAQELNRQVQIAVFDKLVIKRGDLLRLLLLLRLPGATRAQEGPRHEPFGLLEEALRAGYFTCARVECYFFDLPPLAGYFTCARVSRRMLLSTASRIFYLCSRRISNVTFLTFHRYLFCPLQSRRWSAIARLGRLRSMPPLALPAPQRTIWSQQQFCPLQSRRWSCPSAIARLGRLLSMPPLALPAPQRTIWSQQQFCPLQSRRWSCPSAIARLGRRLRSMPPLALPAPQLTIWSQQQRHASQG
jgi:hypothetical protein